MLWQKNVKSKNFQDIQNIHINLVEKTEKTPPQSETRKKGVTDIQKLTTTKYRFPDLPTAIYNTTH